MRFLADMGISWRTVEWLRTHGHEALHLREKGMQRADDEQVMAMAVRENRIVLALDLDFGYLLAVSQSTVPSAALFRVSNERPEAVNARLASVIRLCADDLVAGAIVSVSDTTLRVRRLPI